MVRIDMTEYQEKHTVARMIGAPPATSATRTRGQLTEAVRRRPYAVVLFDEVEKAHPDVLNVLLQLLDDGQLTDGRGRTVDFKNAVVIMTSNLGSQFIAERAGPEGGDVDGAVRGRVFDALQAHFRPEFLNRIDDVILFHALGRAHVREIVRIQLQQLTERLADRRMTIELSDAALDLLADRGFDPVYGARPLKRTVQRMVLDPLARRMLEHELLEGARIRVDAAGAELVFETEASMAA